MKSNFHALRWIPFFQKNEVEPDVIKIDVEGAEFMVLQGMIEALYQQSSTIVLEFLSEKRK
ncbi:MAG: FkbM family methyltransferase [Saprospiraceae bacterium]